ncbi:MAG: TGS domain-containing protein [Sedimentisphaerales bacterium]|nr:TGS domain-containing protein [Sedimentisphaerales bacterium]
MPANLTPEYFKAEQWYREASTNDEKILAMERMLAVIPKHKGTDHMRADLRRKLSKLKEAGTQKSAARHVDVFHVKRSGAGQISLIGAPNSGKSSIVGALTNAKVNIADFPFATGAPVPGMMKYEDIQIQLVDTPPITADFVSPGQVGTYRNCDLIVLVIDLLQDVEEQMSVLMDFLESRRLLIDRDNPATDDSGNLLGRKVFCVCTKSDIAENSAFEKVQELLKGRFDCIKVCTRSADDIDRLGKRLFEKLEIIRVYSKPPGKKVDMKDPFTLPVGSTVLDLARAIHKELADKLRNARIWGMGVYDGQNCQQTHILNDKDVVELHFG